MISKQRRIPQEEGMETKTGVLVGKELRPQSQREISKQAEAIGVHREGG